MTQDLAETRPPLATTVLTVVNAAYCLEGDAESWLRNVAQAFSAAIEGAYGGAGHALETRDGVLHMCSARDAGDRRMPHAESANPLLLAAARARPQLILGSEARLDPGEAAALAGLEQAPARGHDVILLVAGDGLGAGWIAGAAIPHALCPTPAQRARWQNVASHVAIGGLLRRALARLAPQPSTESAALPTTLLRSVIAERMRATREHGQDEASDTVPSWPALAAGTASLVDHFEHDGRWFVVTSPAGHCGVDPRALSARERVVAEQIAFGRSGKEVAYELGLSAATVSQVLHGALRKLRLGSVAQLATLVCARSSIESRRLSIDGVVFVVSSVPAVPCQLPADLSSAERDVLRCVLRGDSNAQVAASRHTAVRTAANQVASIFRKIGVASRAELVARLAR